MKTLVIYYSFEGSTKFIAENIASSLNADLYRVKPVYDIQASKFKQYFQAYDLIRHKCKPQLDDFHCDFNRYDRIYVGTPIWMFNVAPAIRTLLLDKIKDKEVALFYTHKGFEYNFIDHAKTLIEKNNRLFSIHGFANVQQHQMDSLMESQHWVHRFVL